jgi:hypothetical protein
MGKKKGQLVFEFLMAVLILFGIIIYTVNFLFANMNLYHSQFMSNFLESKALQISEVLMNDPTMGFVSAWPHLDTGKISDFDLNYCQSGDPDPYLFKLLPDYELFEPVPYFRYHHVRITVESPTSTLLDCGRTPPGKVSKSRVTRFGYLPSAEIANVTVIVW